MNTFQEYKEKIIKMRSLVNELEKVNTEILNIAGGNIDPEEKALLHIVESNLNNFLFIQENIVNEDEFDEKFEILRNDPFHYLDEEATIRHKLFGLNSILNPITNYTLAAKTYTYEMEILDDEKNIDLMKEIRDEIINLENHVYEVYNKIETEINNRDPYYVSDEELDEWEKENR